MENPERVVVIGAGPAGLTAADALTRAGRRVTVLEKSRQVGGLARTVRHRGYLFDVGGHRFFTRSSDVQRLWETLMGDAFRRVERQSRILYRGRLYHYPLRPLEAMRHMGPWESAWVLASYARKQLFPLQEDGSLERWMINRFGPRLFIMFFKAYTEKVWGLPCSEIRAEWAAQRIHRLTLWEAVAGGLFPLRHTHRTLIRSFHYPERGPGQLWERMASRLEAGGADLRLGQAAVAIHREGQRATAVESASLAGRRVDPADQVIGSMPLGELILSLTPPAPEEVQASARALRHRAFVCVALVLRRRDVFPDNWIYVHSPEARVARIQNFKNWSPAMVPDAETTCLGLEYFCDVADALWGLPDPALVELGRREIVELGMARPEDVVDGIVARETHAYPVYDATYAAHVARLREYLRGFSNLQTIGRNGLHRYDNQDHAMLTALLAARNVLGERHDVWAVNTTEEHHETAI